MNGAELRRLLRWYRADPRSWRARLSDLYGQALYVVIVGGLVVSAARSGVGAVATAAPVRSPDVFHWMTAVTALLVAALLCRMAVVFGPVLVSGAAQSWLLSTPVDRRSLLAPRFFALLGVGAVAGAALGVAVAPPVALVGAPVGVLVCAALVDAQASRRGAAVTRHVTTVVIVAQVVLLAVLAVIPDLPWPHLAATIPAAVTAVVCAAVASWHAHRTLTALTRGSLSAGSEIATATATATTWLNPTLLSDTVVTRQARAAGAVRSVRFRGGRVRSLLRADLTRHRRGPLGLVVFCALLPVPYLVDRVAAPTVTAAVHVVCVYLVADRFARGLRVVGRSPALRRALGGSDTASTLVHLALPTTAALLWTLATAPVLTPVHAALSVLGSVAAVYRGATKPPMEYSSPLLDTPMGAMPIGIIARMLRGPGLVVVVAVVQLSF
ncbi:DUF6297 family protein [Umezawaea sp. Da 62-37]|uniref:DUF6297 family protein n=1 Tax=Umezawaea sp. Da 62-37 TaxID=3075927 RepID=UPI0028F6C9DA|nr:DUF6297 family protein [Umezawaea sp. Da 62-37]WNV88132.1 DUF6297 family protein [Umezawaea sp. Da 62-37]